MPVPVVVEFVAGTAGLLAGIGKARTEMAALTTESSAASARVAAAGVAASAVLVAGAGLVALKAVEMAGDFQSAIVHLTTDAGEAKSNMQMISDGILDIARETGSGTKDLISAMYYIESSGQHGAQALDTLHAAAEGAKVGNADLTVVANALSTVMSGYGEKAGTATQVTDQLVTAVSQGKTKLEDLAGAMATVLPVAEKAHIGLAEVLGAMSTMTAQGQDTAKAATYLRQAIGMLSNPTRKAADEMKALGIDSFALSNDMGKNGLTGTMDILTDAIAKHTEGGAVLIDQLKTSAKSATGFEQVLANLPPTQQTVVAALADMVGGTKSMQAALELTGDQAGKFKDNVKLIGESAKNTSKDVQDWDVIQGTFNQKMSELRSVVETAMIALGQKMLPAVTSLAAKFLEFTGWLGEHTAVLRVLGITIGITLVAALIVAGTALVGFIAPFLIAMAPIMAVIGAIAALAAGLIYLYNNVRPVHDAIEALRHTFKTFTDAFNSDPSRPFWDRLKSAVEAFWPEFKNAMARLGDVLWQWVEPMIAPALAKLGQWTQAGVGWLENTGFPMLGAAMTAVGKALVDWIAPRIQPALAELGNLLGALMDWLTGTGVPWLARTLTRLALEFDAWITPKIPGMLAQLAEMLGQIAQWILTTGVSMLFVASGRIGLAIVQGIIQGIGDAEGSLYSALGNLAQNAVGSALSGISGSISSGVSGLLGAARVPGFATGVTNFEGGMAMVGENGPELVNLPRGSDVHTNSQTKAMTSGGNSGGDVHVHFSGPIYGGPSGMQEVAAIIRTELLKTKARNGGLGLA